MHKKGNSNYVLVFIGFLVFISFIVLVNMLATHYSCDCSCDNSDDESYIVYDSTNTYNQLPIAYYPCENNNYNCYI